MSCGFGDENVAIEVPTPILFRCSSDISGYRDVVAATRFSLIRMQIGEVPVSTVVVTISVGFAGGLNSGVT